MDNQEFFRKYAPTVLERGPSVVGVVEGLIDEFTGRDRGIEQGVARVWSDSANWPSQMHAQTRPFMDKRVWEFISRARAARLRL